MIFFPQCFNNPKGYLLFACLFVVAQGMTVNGLIYVVTSTLEKRFNLTSTRSGFISSCYDIAVLIVILFVTYFGERSHKPRIMGTGALIFGLGSLLFTLPHYLTGYYAPRLVCEQRKLKYKGPELLILSLFVCLFVCLFVFLAKFYRTHFLTETSYQF